MKGRTNTLDMEKTNQTSGLHKELPKIAFPLPRQEAGHSPPPPAKSPEEREIRPLGITLSSIRLVHPRVQREKAL